jgi:TonB-linked SusC/RagA family outer membrane protein
MQTIVKPTQTCLCLLILLLLLLYPDLQMKGYSSTFQDKISISVRDASLADLLRQIAKKAETTIWFKNDDVSSYRGISYEAKNKTVDEILHQLLDNKGFLVTDLGNNSFGIKKKVQSTEFNETADTLITIRGRIVDESGNPLPGANILVKGTVQGAAAANDGSFIINNVKSSSQTAVISMVGYQTKEQLISISKSLYIKLNTVTSTLDETIVVGYGQTTKRFNIGSSVSVKAQEIAGQPVTNPLLALQGRVAGMTVVQENGIPGAGLRIQIRGLNSLNGSQPLYVVDGVPVEPNLLSGPNSLNYYNPLTDKSVQPSTFSLIDPSNIESIDILKDAEATSIYGSRGANGVVLITTKKGKAGDTKVDVNFSKGWGHIINTTKLLNRRQYLDMRYEALRNDHAVLDPNDFISRIYNPDLLVWDTTRSTDWQKKLIGNTAEFLNANASISGGMETVQYLVGANYQRQTSVFPGDFSDKKGNVFFSLSGNSKNNRFNFQLKAGYTTDNNTLPGNDFTGEAVRLTPVAPKLYNDDGGLNWENSTWNNPLAKTNEPYQFKNDNLNTSAALSIKLLPGLEFRSSVGYNSIKGESYSATPFAALDPSVWQNNNRRAFFENTNSSSWIVEPQLYYEKQIKRGKFSILAGGSGQNSYRSSIATRAWDFESDESLKNLVAGKNFSSSNMDSRYKYSAIFSRISYTLADKYLFNLSARRDGSSRFGPGKQFGNFGSVGAAWIFSSEEFVNKHIPALSYGKLRMSYGTSGNDQIADYAYLQQFRYSPSTYAGGSGLIVSGLYDSYYHWEVTKKFEIGLETGFFSDRVLLTLNHYRNRSGNQLLPAPLASYVGPGIVIINRNAVIQNVGYELMLNTVNVKDKNFRWTTSFNISFNKNKLLKYENLEGSADDYLLDVGQSTWRRRVYNFAGVDPNTGVYQFYDKEGKLTTTPNNSNINTTDQTVFIDLNPTYYGGFQNTISYKGVTLDFLFQFVKQKGQNYLYNGTITPGSFFAGNQPVSVLRRWTKEGDQTDIQRFNQDFQLLGSADYARNSSQLYSDASYIRLKNVNISINLLRKMGKKVTMRTCDLVFSAQNLLTITHYKGVDPETQSSNVLPPLRMITAGFRLGF